ncbi:MAG: response regulator [Eubacteriales bacterium]|nr:response regulator [Eubacteriales bacterium]
MLRLLIVDDERAIRESIRDAIDWETLGISVVGLYKNGVEAYDAILDEYPDIVLTDIKMPGLSGLELIAKVKEAQLDTQFVILSGYAEFEFAKEAMRWGVRHYLLKPTQPEQITQIMEEVREECYQLRRRAAERAEQTPDAGMGQRLIRGLLTEALSGDAELSELLNRNQPFVDFENVNYEQITLLYVEPQHAEKCAAKAMELHEGWAKNVPLHMLYVNYALIFFFQSYTASYAQQDAALSAIRPAGQSLALEYEHTSYVNLSALLHELLPRLMRFDTVDLMSGMGVTRIHNDSRILREGGGLVTQLAQGDAEEREKALHRLTELLASATDVQFLRQMVSGFLVKYLMLRGETDALPDIARTESMEDAESLRALALDKLRELSVDADRQDVVAQIKRYVRQNLSNSQLSLKWLAENRLYMNVDYLSKQFAQKTGEKFSAYLTRKRIERAKELLLDSAGHVYDVADQVGCGNNPQYFSQIFRRAVGVTPTEFVRAAQRP